MDPELLALLADLHLHNHRQGPGSPVAFARALDLSGIDAQASLEIADIGCGTGATSLSLTQTTQASITAVDLLPAFLDELTRRADALGVRDRIEVIEADMGDLPFEREQFDVIWSEGAIYNLGFSRGIREWREYLKPGGVLVVTEITWLTAKVPDELRQHWEGEYSEMALASTKLRQLEDYGYTPIGYFALPADCWLEEYYVPLAAGFDDFLARHAADEMAREVVAAEKREIALYEKFQDHYSYGCYVARKVA